jgi:hypothetical protein
MPAHSIGMVYVKCFTQLATECELRSKSSSKNGKQKEEPLEADAITVSSLVAEPSPHSRILL